MFNDICHRFSAFFFSVFQRFSPFTLYPQKMRNPYEREKNGRKISQIRKNLCSPVPLHSHSRSATNMLIAPTESLEPKIGQEWKVMLAHGTTSWKWRSGYRAPHEARDKLFWRESRFTCKLGALRRWACSCDYLALELRKPSPADSFNYSGPTISIALLSCFLRHSPDTEAFSAWRAPMNKTTTPMTRGALYFHNKTPHSCN